MLAARIVDASNPDNSWIENNYAIVPINRKQLKKDDDNIKIRYEELKKKNGYLVGLRLARIEFIEKLLNEKQ